MTQIIGPCPYCNAALQIHVPHTEADCAIRTCDAMARSLSDLLDMLDVNAAADRFDSAGKPIWRLIINQVHDAGQRIAGWKEVARDNKELQNQVRTLQAESQRLHMIIQAFDEKNKALHARNAQTQVDQTKEV